MGRWCPWRRNRLSLSFSLLVSLFSFLFPLAAFRGFENNSRVPPPLSLLLAFLFLYLSTCWPAGGVSRSRPEAAEPFPRLSLVSVPMTRFTVPPTDGVRVSARILALEGSFYCASDGFGRQVRLLKTRKRSAKTCCFFFKTNKSFFLNPLALLLNIVKN